MTSNRKAILTALLFAIVIAVGVFINWDNIRSKLEQERVDPAALAALENTPLAAIQPFASSAGWPQWRGPNRDGVAPAGPFRTDWKTNPPKPVWSVPCGGGYGQPIVVAGKLYLHDYAEGKERLRCLDANTGEVKWEHADVVDYSGFKLGYGSGPRATPTIHEGRIYTVGATGLFNCFVLPIANELLQRIWKHELLAEFDAKMPTWGVASSPLIVNDTVVVQPGGKKGSVVGLHAKTGEVRWTVGNGPSGYSSPILATDNNVPLIVAMTGDSIYGFNGIGELMWAQSWVTQHFGNIATPIAVGGYLFVSSSYGKGCGLFQISNPEKGAVPAKEVYFRKNRVMSNHHSTCVYRDGFLYGFDGSELACVDLKKGERVADWHATDDDGREFSKGSLTLVGDKLLGLTETGTLFLGTASHEGFTFLGQVKNIFSGRESWAAPVVVDGRIYVRDGEKIVCFEVK